MRISEKQNQDRTLLPSIIATLFALAISRKACQLALHPLFGSTGSQYHLDRSLQIIDLLLVPLTRSLLPCLAPTSMTVSSILAAFLVWRAPDTFGRWLANHAGSLDVYRGPLIFQLAAYWPIRWAGMAVSHAAAVNLINQYTKPTLQENKIIDTIYRISLPLALHSISQAMLPWASRVLDYLPACQIFDITPALLLASALLSSIMELSKGTRFLPIKRVNAAIVVFCIAGSLLLPFPKQLCRDPDGWEVNPTGDVAYIPLARKLSSTGMLLVGELTQKDGSQFRFLRCDHSLLGGIWIGLARQDVLSRSAHSSPPMTPEDIDRQAVLEAESVYPTFILQSAVRLVEKSPGNSTVRQGKPKALILGVGVGVSARVLMNDGVVLTVVEIDAVVYEYAQQYFGFPTPEGGIFLEDARAYLHRQDQGQDAGPFDYVIHDVFTGGSVPSSLFTLECWQAIRAKLKDDGVLAVNFVGRPASEAASFVLTTLFRVFPFCRAFSEDSGAPLSDSDYQNMVIFCSPTGRPRFRKPTEIEGFEPSVYQSRVLASFEAHEFDLGRLAASSGHVGPEEEEEDRDGQAETLPTTRESFILTDHNSAQLDRAQIHNALFHWEIMRKVLPQEVWNSYY
ncbi:hypothetical protein PCASD_16328 [Puccinia coronata f. sp. avenae]|uniref:PABS domain-containing protein n=1 Tax=Puccinia coronata f. sp. avenae TaxID=200324 RepID=A0A2N5TXP9_9BASI|nr:hypothetical protein PCASD_16328 [Puccinia coronata f. sp. avenae]